MASRRQAERLRRRREFAYGPDVRAIDEHFSRRRRDFETHATHIVLTLTGLHADRSGRLRVRRRWIGRIAG